MESLNGRKLTAIFLWILKMMDKWFYYHDSVSSTYWYDCICIFFEYRAHSYLLRYYCYLLKRFYRIRSFYRAEVTKICRTQNDLNQSKIYFVSRFQPCFTRLYLSCKSCRIKIGVKFAFIFFLIIYLEISRNK